MTHDVSQFVAVLRRVPFFKGLRPEQATALLQACERKTLEAGQMLCRAGDASNGMFILLAGRLSVRTKDGTQVAVVEPVSPIGEMGLFTGEPRSANVVATAPSTLFDLSRTQLTRVMRGDRDLELAVSRAVIATLSDRIRDANRELSHLRALIADQEAGREEPQEGAPSASP
jgi:CRP-like cAMP-binding protein